MSKKVVLLLLCLIGSVGINVILSFNYNQTLINLKSREETISGLTNEVNSLTTELSETEWECNSLQESLIDKTSECEMLQEDLDKSNLAYKNLENILTITITNLEKKAEDEYSRGREEGWLSGNQSGYQTGYEVGIEVGASGEYEGWFVKDPTYNEAMSFMRTDRTDEKSYIENEYTCMDFSATFKNNAYKKGYRCFLVWIDFEGETTGHSIVGFNTTDRGMIYIEPQADYLVKLKEGTSYWNEALISPYEYIVKGSDIIEGWRIYW